MTFTESLYHYFKGCRHLRYRFQIPYEQMDNLRNKLIDRMRKGEKADEAFEETLQDVMQQVPQTKDWLLEELLKSLPQDIRDQIESLMDDIRNKLEKSEEIRKQRKKEFEELLDQLSSEQDPFKNIKQERLSAQVSDNKKTKFGEQQPIPSPQDLTRFLRQLEKTLREAQSKGQNLDELFKQLKSIPLPQSGDIPDKLVPLKKPLKPKRAFDAKALKKIQEKLRNELLKTLQQSGTLQLKHGKLTFGEDLIEIMADRILTEILKQIRQTEEGVPVEKSGEQLGEITKIGLLQSQDEIGRMLPIETLMAALQKHPEKVTIDPWEDPVKVWKYRRETIFDTIIAVDLSGSMNRNFKHQSAKETALALNRAVRKINPKNRTALIIFQTTAFPATPDEVWDTRPTGYTNTPEAIRLAAEALRQWNSKSSYILFVTDGFPELPGKSHQRVLQEAVEEASKLKQSPTTLFRMVLIENKQRFIDAGRKIVKAANGKLIVTNPDRLRENVLTDFLQGFRDIVAG
ncbi:MAG: VWA domain-containing protein [Candidatus Ranarchaeia archaeon]